MVDESHRNHHTLLLTAADFMGVAVENLLRAGEEHLFKERDNAFFGSHRSTLIIRSILMGFQHFEDLCPAFLHGVE